MKQDAKENSNAVREKAERRRDTLHLLEAVSYWKETLPDLEKMEKEDPVRMKMLVMLAGQSYPIPQEGLPGSEGTEEKDLAFYQKAVAYYDGMISLLPQAERTVLTIYSSNAFTNQRLEIAKQALHLERTQVWRIRNTALDHVHEMRTGIYNIRACNPLKIGNTHATRLQHTA